MGYVIGDNALELNTWGILRGAMTQDNVPLSYVNNVEYPDNYEFFKTEEGNGLLKQGLTDIFTVARLKIYLHPTLSELRAINIDENYHGELVGKMVTNDSAETFGISATAFIAPSYQTLSPGPTTTLVVDIEVFDPIS